VPTHCYLQNKLGKTQARAKRNYMNKQEKLLKIISDLTELTTDFGGDDEIGTFDTLNYHLNCLIKLASLIKVGK
jgi:hypothetical protein